VRPDDALARARSILLFLLGVGAGLRALAAVYVAV
jgi:hypothetical protein